MEARSKMSAATGAVSGTSSRGPFSNFFTIARFGPDTLVIFAILSAMGIALYYWGIWYLAAAVLSTLIAIFCVESLETIHMSRAEYRQIVGARCLVLQGSSIDRRGIVRLFNVDGSLDPELWSTEVSKEPVNEGSLALVTGMNSVILEITKVQFLK
jgi:hypothetical protein